MKNIEVILTLASPVSLGRLLYAPTLDSVLSALIADDRGEQAVPDELRRCVAVYDGVPAASALWPESPTFEVGHTHLKTSVAAGTWTWCGRKIDEQRGEFLTKMSKRRTFYSTQWTWWAEGDIEVVSGWLGHLTSVGAKRSAGFGAVVNVNAHLESEAGWRVHGTNDLVLSRPVPLEALDGWLEAEGLTKADLDDARYATVPLPAWPVPPWDGGAAVPTVVPLLLADTVNK